MFYLTWIVLKGSGKVVSVFSKFCSKIGIANDIHVTICLFVSLEKMGKYLGISPCGFDLFMLSASQPSSRLVILLEGQILMYGFHQVKILGKTGILRSGEGCCSSPYPRLI